MKPSSSSSSRKCPSRNDEVSATAFLLATLTPNVVRTTGRIGRPRIADEDQRVMPFKRNERSEFKELLTACRTSSIKATPVSESFRSRVHGTIARNSSITSSICGHFSAGSSICSSFKAGRMPSTSAGLELPCSCGSSIKSAPGLIATESDRSAKNLFIAPLNSAGRSGRGSATPA